MQCPIDQTNLQMTERQGIEIDYCPTCRGVWLDRGELDKIIERNFGQEPQSRRGPNEGRYERGDERYERGEERYDRGSAPASRQQKKRSFLSDLFEFD